MTARLFVSCLAGSLLVVCPAVPAAAQGGTWQSFCASEPAGATPVVYVTPIFDSQVYFKGWYRPIAAARQYEEYLKGRYGYKPGVTSVASCGHYQDLAQAEAGNAAIEKLAKDANHPVVSVDWSYHPDSAEVAFSESGADSEQQRPDDVRRSSNRAQLNGFTFEKIENARSALPREPQGQAVAEPSQGVLRRRHEGMPQTDRKDATCVSTPHC